MLFIFLVSDYIKIVMCHNKDISSKVKLLSDENTMLENTKVLKNQNRKWKHWQYKKEKNGFKNVTKRFEACYEKLLNLEEYKLKTWKQPKYHH